MDSPRCVTHVLTMLALAATLGAQAPMAPVDLLDGLDPVELVAGREVPGVDTHTITHRGYRYLFASAANLATFRKDPGKYEPVAGGTCARMGAGGPGNPALFTVFEGRIYLFSSADCRKAFDAAPRKFIEPPIDRTRPAGAAEARGRAILERAVTALGGAARLDALTGYVLERHVTRATPQGRRVIPEQVTVVFPDAIRMESKAPQGTMVVAAAGDDMFMSAPMRSGGRVLRWPEAVRQVSARDMTRRILRDPIGLLRERRSPDTIVEALEAQSDREHDRVRITVRETQATLAVRRDSGMPASVTYLARNGDSVVAAVTVTFGDYREVSGLKVPFAADAAFGAEKSEGHSFTLASWTPNPPITRAELMREPALAVPQ